MRTRRLFTPAPISRVTLVLMGFDLPVTLTSHISESVSALHLADISPRIASFKSGVRSGFFFPV